MKIYSKVFLVFLAVIAVLGTIGLEIASAQQYSTFTGTALDVQRRMISVKNDKGDVMVFAVGRKTIYIPDRKPLIGERIKVTYFFNRGENVGTQVEMLK